MQEIAATGNVAGPPSRTAVALQQQQPPSHIAAARQSLTAARTPQQRAAVASKQQGQLPQRPVTMAAPAAASQLPAQPAVGTARSPLEQVQQAAQVLQWFAQEAAELPAAARWEALRCGAAPCRAMGLHPVIWQAVGCQRAPQRLHLYRCLLPDVLLKSPLSLGSQSVLHSLLPCYELACAGLPMNRAPPECCPGGVWHPALQRHGCALPLRLCYFFLPLTQCQMRALHPVSDLCILCLWLLPKCALPAPSALLLSASCSFWSLNQCRVSAGYRCPWHPRCPLALLPAVCAPSLLLRERRAGLLQLSSRPSPAPT